jgi:hypothetical protein
MQIKLKVKDGSREFEVEGYVEIQQPELYRLAMILFTAQTLGAGRLTERESVNKAQVALKAFMDVPLPTGRYPYLEKKAETNDDEKASK